MLDRGGVFPKHDHNPADYGIPRGLDRFAALIDERGTDVLLNGVLSAGRLIIHEFGNCIGNISQGTSLVRVSGADERDKHLDQLQVFVTLAVNYLEGLKCLREGRLPSGASVDIRAMIDQVRVGLNPLDSARLNLSEELKVCAIERPVAQCFSAISEAIVRELVKNAMKHTCGQVFIVVAVSGSEAKWVEVRVEDEGAALLEEAVRNLFRPPFHSAQQGNGLGLPLMRVYARFLRGELVYQPTERSGQRKAFVLRLPLAPRT